MLISEIQMRCREVAMHMQDRDLSAAQGVENQMREQFIAHVAGLKIPVLSVKAQMVLSTRHSTQRVKEVEG
jgi:hypothetical protein